MDGRPTESSEVIDQLRDEQHLETHTTARDEAETQAVRYLQSVADERRAQTSALPEAAGHTSSKHDEESDIERYRLTSRIDSETNTELLTETKKAPNPTAPGPASMIRSDRTRRSTTQYRGGSIREIGIRCPSCGAQPGFGYPCAGCDYLSRATLPMTGRPHGGALRPLTPLRTYSLPNLRMSMVEDSGIQASAIHRSEAVQAQLATTRAPIVASPRHGGPSLTAQPLDSSLALTRSHEGLWDRTASALTAQSSLVNQPSMNPQQHQQSNGGQNGFASHLPNGAPAVSGGPGGGGSVGMFPTSAGHQMDLNHLWGQVQELSGLLERNRESTAGIVRRVGELRDRGGPQMEELLAGANDDGTNGETVAPSLHARLEELEGNNIALEAENGELASLLSTYENALTRILDQLRVYAHEHTMSTLAIHKSYTQQLATERDTNLELRQELVDWKSRLSGLAGMMREGLRWEEGEGDGGGVAGGGLKALEAWAEVKNENRVLRGLVGLPVEDEEEEQDEARGMGRNEAPGSGRPEIS
ncbi:MAG: hypothetical protein M1817_004116 [Caeruleum heppii]|nr:MAG: hypothetical protein M1817_004116 [Caeruleum heppii]